MQPNWATFVIISINENRFEVNLFAEPLNMGVFSFYRSPWSENGII